METIDHQPNCACGLCADNRRQAALRAAKELPSARRSEATCSAALAAEIEYATNQKKQCLSDSVEREERDDASGSSYYKGLAVAYAQMANRLKYLLPNAPGEAEAALRKALEVLRCHEKMRREYAERIRKAAPSTARDVWQRSVGVAEAINLVKALLPDPDSKLAEQASGRRTSALWHLPTLKLPMQNDHS